ncbi:ankyrin repeat domain-containing protein [Candidatus Cardinium hertigii]|uniref:ankyrin repeat domain-containing protein n=1 Tax=Candidatus Cardinium hertigii TaxID=247481 RepID=UPI003D7C417D
MALDRLVNRENCKKFFQAIVEKNIEDLHSWLQSGVDVNCRSTSFEIFHQTAIDLAWENGWYDGMLELLKFGSRFPENFALNDLTDESESFKMLKNIVNGRESLHKAIRQGNLEKVNSCLTSLNELGENTTCSKFISPSNQSALETAVQHPNLAIIADLLGFPSSLPEGNVTLTPEQHMLLQPVNIENNSLLALAAQCGQQEVVNFLLRCGVDVNDENKNGKKVIDLAWENNYYNIVLSLLKADSGFPVDFEEERLSDTESDEKNLKSFVKNRDDFHKCIARGQISDVEEYVKQHPSRLYLNSKNQSALKTAIINNKYDTYGLLHSIEARFINKEEAECISSLNEGQKDDLKKAMVAYYPLDKDAHINFLISKSRSKTPIKEFETTVKGLYTQLSEIQEVAAMLKVLFYADYLVGPEILFLNKFIEWIFLYNIYGLSGALFFLPKI